MENVYAVDLFRAYSQCSKEIASKAITDLAFNANQSFGFLNDPARHCTIVVGEKKPDDLLLLGIVWEQQCH